jgi:hypothetical protein
VNLDDIGCNRTAAVPGVIVRMTIPDSVFVAFDCFCNAVGKLLAFLLPILGPDSARFLASWLTSGP